MGRTKRETHDELRKTKQSSKILQRRKYTGNNSSSKLLLNKIYTVKNFVMKFRLAFVSSPYFLIKKLHNIIINKLIA